MPLTIASTTAEQVPVTVNPVTSGGRPAQLDGPIRVTVQSGLATVVQDPSTPLVFTARSGDDPGETVYLVEGDADLGAGVVTIQDLVTYTVAGELASSFGMTSGPAQPKS